MTQTTVDLVVGLAQAFAWPVIVVGLLLLWRRPLLDLVGTLQSRSFDVSAGPFAVRVERAAQALETAMRETGNPITPEDARRLLAREPRELAGLEGRRVLWVDDHPEHNREELRVMELLGFDVEVARTTAEGVRRNRISLFDAVITDMDREGEPSAGLDLARQLRHHGFAGPIFVYLMNFDPRLGKAPEVTEITNRPDDLVRYLVGSLTR